MAQIRRVKRLKLGLIFTGSYDWVGGLYYLRNIVLSLNTLEESKKPALFIIYNKKTPVELIKSTNYPYLTFLHPKELSTPKKIINKINFLLTENNPFYTTLIKKYNIDFLYPFNDYSEQYDSFNSQKISWIYDFQHKILPELFNKYELANREREFSLITSKAETIVVSSEDSKNHLLKFYPGTRANIKVFPFVSIINQLKLPDFDSVKGRYNLNERYFLVSNQFWQHKNHKVIFDTLKNLKDKAISIKIVFTGQKRDTRNPNYFQDVENFIDVNKLGDMVKILGFIPREEQLALMKESIAVIQPSKFEGWGTVVEDVKSMGKPVILSDIDVHHEQMKEFGYYFQPDDSHALAELLIKFSNPSFVPKIFPDNQNGRINDFAQNFVSIFNSTAARNV